MAPHFGRWQRSTGIALSVATLTMLSACHLVAEDPQREIPGKPETRQGAPVYTYESLPDLAETENDYAPVLDRWRMLYNGHWYDPYHQNILKADLPVFGTQAHPWFVELGLVSDSLVEHRRLPIPVGGPSTNRPNSLDTFGHGDQTILAQNFIFSFALVNGNTTFRPQEFEFRAVPVVTITDASVAEDGALRIDPEKGNDRTDNHLGFLELFADVHLENLTRRYDFISTRIGIQKFSSDFRGFVFADEAPGVRVFGNYANNRYQYNLGWFSRLDKDTNSGVNTFDARHEQVVVANLYRQDTFALGHTLSASILHREDTAGDFGDDYDNNGFLVRPASIGDERAKNISTTYLGLAGDGHFGRINTTTALYYVTGSESHNPIAGRQVDISAQMAAAEISYDKDWLRFRASLFWGSGDDDPFDSRAGGFDAIVDSPNFAGGDLSFWQRQGIPFIGGGGVNLTSSRSLLANLRAGKEEGQSNFVNPGIWLYNLGLDIDVTPTVKIINNVSYLAFDDVDSLQALRQDGSIGHAIGIDLSSGLVYRPFLNNNVQVRCSGAVLFPETGLKNLYGEKNLWDITGNLILLY